MPTIYLTRHGETEWNTENRLQGWKDSPLTIKGQQYAEKLGQRLRDTSFEAIYSSPSERAFKTAKLICKGRTTPIQTDVRLKEINMGDWEGKTHDFIKQYDLEAYTAFWEAPHLYQSETGESFECLSNRMLEFLQEIQTNHSNGEILLVTHGIAINFLLSHFKGVSMEDLWTSSPFIHGTSLTIVDATDSGYSVLLEGDMMHIEQETIS